MKHLMIPVLLIALATLTGGAAPAESASGEQAAPQRDARPMMDLLRRADTNEDGKVSLEELHAVAPDFPKARFEQLDRNGDGFLSPDDRPARPDAAQPGDRRAEFLKRLRAADTDGDGKVSREEFDKAFPKAPEQLFSRLDTNGDGVISPADRPGSPQGRPGAAALRERFRAADTDGDGKVSLEEFKAANPDAPAGRFERLDRDGNGFLSPADLRQRGPRQDRQPERERPRREERSKPAAE
jgi:Ca2+-binding EF-hand superfamily protein